MEEEFHVPLITLANPICMSCLSTKCIMSVWSSIVTDFRIGSWVTIHLATLLHFAIVNGCRHVTSRLSCHHNAMMSLAANTCTSPLPSAYVEPGHMFMIRKHYATHIFHVHLQKISEQWACVSVISI